jgi:hypothetical protein
MVEGELFKKKVRRDRVEEEGLKRKGGRRSVEGLERKGWRGVIQVERLRING